MALLLDAGVTTTGWGTGVLLLFAVSLPVAVASWFAVERPALKLAARISGEGTRDRDLPHRRPGELIGSGRSS
jgi:peptidoglycan/LPS O-acetylase OafA/YrhL